MIDRARAYGIFARGWFKAWRRRTLRALRRCPDCGGRTRRAWNYWGAEGRACARHMIGHSFVAKRQLDEFGPGIVSQTVVGFPGNPDPHEEPDHLELL